MTVLCRIKDGRPGERREKDVDDKQNDGRGLPHGLTPNATTVISLAVLPRHLERAAQSRKHGKNNGSENGRPYAIKIIPLGQKTWEL